MANLMPKPFQDTTHHQLNLSSKRFQYWNLLESIRRLGLVNPLPAQYQPCLPSHGGPYPR
ncbi:hypothetical protein I7I48_05893 [Histoplasma ohiense]|nr:hypothetical protein I7I48_05893 [Histoplasma ohiense (nom. inval.)]